MDVKLCLLVLAGICALSIEASNSHKHKLVAYWGQNAVYNERKQRQFWEKDLIDFCRDYNYDVIVLSFLNVFFDNANKDSFPGFNFAFHCETPISNEYPKMFRCPKIEEGVKECQKRGKKVLMSLGGAVGRYGFQSVSQAKLFAYRVYNLLLDGEDLKNLRPFGTAILDGVDLDIEGGSYQYYTEFIQELKSMKQSIIVGAAPQCPYPDRLLGPSPGRVLGDVPKLIDEVYIQFYNNWCHTGNTRVFNDHVEKWMKYSRDNNGPMIFVGVPANTRASGTAAHYRPPNELKKIYDNLKDEPRFGGFMIWDASFDQNNIVNGKRYSEHIRDMFNSKGPIPTGDPKTLKPGSKKPTDKPVATDKPTRPTRPTRPTSVSCVNLKSGVHPHPKDCSKFFECNGNRATVKDCPPGLKFNPERSYCDWPRNVKC